ncbi:hypothetical protein [Legionella fairfieldensis]|uniref:hypothetical protein n=1 Tax=Legionella fairfieldensis TaxID=45064 RepID=UPI00048DBB17|nr:hypothetical protein [Legionella fairfieldensis]
MLYTDIKQKIHNDLIVPLLQSKLKKSDCKNIVTKIFMNTRWEYVEDYMRSIKLSGFSDIIKKIHNYYYDKNTQKSEFPKLDFEKEFDFSSYEELTLICINMEENQRGKPSAHRQIQFLIQECFFDYFNPFDKMNPEELKDPKNTAKIKKLAANINLSLPTIGNFPTDAAIIKNIASFLNYGAIQSWRKTCRSAFFQSAYEPKLSFFYTLGAPVEVPTPKKGISNIRASFSSYEKSDDMLLFTSLYQAIEYAQLHNKYIHQRSMNNVAIPGVFLVAYRGSLSTLKFTDEFILLNPGNYNTGKYNQNARCVWVQSAKVNKELLTPIRGITALNTKDFATYKTPQRTLLETARQKLHF